MNPDCKGRQYGDEWHCDACGLVWDVNDDDPPECRPCPPPVRAGGDRFDELYELLQHSPKLCGDER